MATSDKPAPGRVLGELSLHDLELFMSDREARYGGDWEKAMLALAHEIDPGGAMHIWNEPAPAPTDPTRAVHEGGLSWRMLNGTPWAAAMRQAHLLPPGTLIYDWNSLDGFYPQLIVTLARIDKYGEPEFGLRKAVLAVAHFLAGDLAGVPAAPAMPVAYEQQAQAQGTVPAEGLPQIRATIADLLYHEARQVLEKHLQYVNPRYIPGWLQRGKPKLSQIFGVGSVESERARGKAPATLDLDEWDLASAALEIVMTTDAQGRVVWLLPDDGRFRDGRAWWDEYYLPSLAEIAARRAQFGGSAADKSAEDAVGCKAFAVLVALLDWHGRDAVAWNAREWSRLREAGFAPELHARNSTSSVDMVDRAAAARRMEAAFQARRSALILGGMPDEQNARQDADYMVSLTMDRTFRPANEWGEEVPLLVATTHDLVDYGTGPGHDVFKQIVEKRYADARAGGDSIYNNYWHAVQAYDASQSDWTRVVANKVCALPPAPPRVQLIVRGVQHDFVVDKIYLGVPTLIQVFFDEPFDQPEYPVTLALGGGKTSLSARPVDEDRRIFETEIFMPTQ